MNRPGSSTYDYDIPSMQPPQQLPNPVPANALALSAEIEAQGESLRRARRRRLLLTMGLIVFAMLMVLLVVVVAAGVLSQRPVYTSDDASQSLSDNIATQMGKTYNVPKGYWRQGPKGQWLYYGLAAVSDVAPTVTESIPSNDTPTPTISELYTVTLD